MNKPTYFVGEIVGIDTFTQRLRKSVITFFLSTTMALSATAVNQYYTRIEKAPQSLITVSATERISGAKIPDGIEIFANNSYTSLDMTELSFKALTTRQPEAVELEPVMKFIINGIGSIDAERVSVDCDIDSKVLNIAYRLPNDILLSVSKPLITMDDNFVVFNLFHKRDLLVSKNATIDLLAKYINNIETTIHDLA